MAFGILVFGLNGSGKTTLGEALALRVGYKHMDIEAYSFMPSSVPFTVPRTPDEMLALIQSDVNENEHFVLSAVTGAFGEAVSEAIHLGIYLSVPYEVRIERIKQRSIERFGDRVLPGGDMYHREQEFLKAAKKRTSNKINHWLDTVSFPIIVVDGLNAVDENVALIEKHIQKMQRQATNSRRSYYPTEWAYEEVF